MAAPKEISSNKMFGGVNKRYEHESATLGCTMKFSIYFPPAATSSRVPASVPTFVAPAHPFRRLVSLPRQVIYWLSGLTCTDENFIQKSFAQKYASEHGVALIVPDTSPRKLPHPPPSPHPSLCTRRPGNARKPASEHGHLPCGPKPASEHGVALIVPDTSPRGLKVEGESDNWDFGVGAGFYVNATVPKWKNWQMYDYVTEETLSSYVTEETLSSYVTEELHRILESTQRQSKKRGLKVEGESDNWDFGVGAGFYVNATVPKWKNWQMYDYVTEELHRILSAHYTNLDMQRCSLMGHSMGGHGALIIFFRNSTKYKAEFRVRIRPHLQPHGVPLGAEGLHGVFGDDKAALGDAPPIDSPH
ncbi:unnamed protein product [Closterium sp. NIES-64]|nr:unnamed protein product [Closterium sp. NIES-64]